MHPVSKCSAKVITKGNTSYMEMLLEGVSCKGKKVDTRGRVTIYSDKRDAKVEAFSETEETVQFATGINYFKNLEVVKQANYIATWGIHPEDVAAEKVNIAAAILFDKNDFEKQIGDGDQYLVISKPTKSMETFITSANERESQVNTFERFIKNLQIIR